MNRHSSFWSVRLVAILLLAVAGALGCGQKPDAGVVRVAYSPFAVNLPFFVALERGYFEEEGVIVEATEMPSADAHTVALVADRIDATVSMPTLTALRVAEEARGKPPFRIVLYNWLTAESSPDGFLIPGDTAISDLGGRRLGTLPDLTWRAFSRVIIKEASGSEPSAVVDVAPTSQMDVVGSGQIDALFTIEPFLAVGEGRPDLRVEGRGSMARYLRDPLVAGGFTISERLLTDQPRVAAAYVRALIRAASAIEADPLSTLPVLAKYLPIPEAVAQRVQLNRYVVATPSTIADFQGTIELYVREGLVSEAIPAELLIWSSANTEVD